MSTSIQQHLQILLGESIKAVSPVSGGDISRAHSVETSHTGYFVKSSSGRHAPAMYEAEAKGLQQLKATKTIEVPEVYKSGNIDGVSYLVMEFVTSKQPSERDFEHLGRQLAQLHLAETDPQFGNDYDNFIGSLPQSNRQHKDWATFYTEERLVPQLKMAVELKLLSEKQLPATENMLKTCQNLFGQVTPSLLHGDLWGGNYLISIDGVPYLIDPAVYIGHSEVDLAMSRLFGGFGTSFYESYHDIIPPHENQKELNDIYQLYYLLVHLNLFGSSYRGSVLRILQRYFM